ncbi:helix-turn-helix transcriptional regulator [soil metagenome]
MARLDMTKTVGTVGEYLREQRNSAELSLRQVADLAGVSNPYLSQVERGLRKPSAEVLQGLAKALRISAETLYVRAGILDPDEGGARSVELAVLADTGLNERQKQALLGIYAAFRAESPSAHPDPDPTPRRPEEDL